MHVGIIPAHGHAGGHAFSKVIKQFLDLWGKTATIIIYVQGYIIIIVSGYNNYVG